MGIWFYLQNCSSVASFSVPQVKMCPFGDIKDVPDSCDGISGFFTVGSSCAVCPLSKTVLNLSLADSCVELQSVTDQASKHPTPSEVRANSLSWAKLFELSNNEKETLS